jgi:hypothetical protein
MLRVHPPHMVRAVRTDRHAPELFEMPPITSNSTTEHDPERKVRK